MEKYILLKVCVREFKKPNPEFLERPVKPLSKIQFLQKKSDDKACYFYHYVH